MANSMIAAAVAAAVAIVLLAPVSAGARGGGTGGAAAGARGGFGAVRALAPGPRRFGASPFFRNGSFRSGANALTRPNRRFYRFPYPVVLPDGDWLYGAYYDTTGSAAPSGPTVGDGNPANLPPAQRDVQFMIYRPSCRLQTQTSVVPADGGGKRDIEITRCISELPPAAARPENGPSRQSAGADAPDRRLQTSAAGSTSADETDEGSRVTKRICQVDAQHVRSEDGGERTITIRRC